MGSRITDSGNVYLEDQLVGKIIMDNKEPYFQQARNSALNIKEQEKIIELINLKFK